MKPCSFFETKPKEKAKQRKTIILAGNPNVGKSTVFNALTGLKQHTGNWTGKTVSGAEGSFETENLLYKVIDTPGTYSLTPHSAEEEAARGIICFENTDLVVVVCDATCLERNLSLALQIMEVSHNVILCVNLIDQAEKRGIKIDTELLSRRLKIPVVAVSATEKETLNKLVQTIEENVGKHSGSLEIVYPDDVEEAVSAIENVAENRPWSVPSHWLGVKLLEAESSLLQEFERRYGQLYKNDGELAATVENAKLKLRQKGYTPETLQDTVAQTIIKLSEKICDGAVTYTQGEYSHTDRKADRILTGRFTAFPVMMLFLIVIFWITVTGANIPSQWLSEILFSFENVLLQIAETAKAPKWLSEILVCGVYRVLAWVISVMLPPMAIFFPLFTLLEDSGYLPRIAYNLDKPFRRCNACGKQALTMCMGFGCNAVGVTGCRIIDSPRERMLAILTNSFVPCNGRFPMIITMITIFFVGTQGGLVNSFLSAVILAAVVTVSGAVTFAVTYILSKTVLKGMPSAFVLELPSFRRPQFRDVLVRSVTDRILFVLGRAVTVAAPAGAVIWLMANITVNGESVLNCCAQMLDPFAQLIGLDGVILMAFILGFPANEIVLPIAVMAYTAQGTVTELGNIMEIKQMLIQNGWTVTTAICTILFSVMHWPCSTTLLTVKKETGSIKWMLLAAAVPTVTGIAVCAAVNLISEII